MSTEVALFSTLNTRTIYYWAKGRRQIDAFYRDILKHNREYDRIRILSVMEGALKEMEILISPIDPKFGLLISAQPGGGVTVHSSKKHHVHIPCACCNLNPDAGNVTLNMSVRREIMRIHEERKISIIMADGGRCFTTRWIEHPAHGAVPVKEDIEPHENFPDGIQGPPPMPKANLFPGICYKKHVPVPEAVMVPWEEFAHKSNAVR
jgi:hypothetical protein